jgi:hypothetical protein
VRVILNKSDQVDQQQLMRVYGALMWSLGKVFRSPEVGARAPGLPMQPWVATVHRLLDALVLCPDLLLPHAPQRCSA